MFRRESIQPTAIYVTLDDDQRALSAGLVILRKLRPHPVPIVVQLKVDDGVATLLRSDGDGRGAFENISMDLACWIAPADWICF